MRTKNKWEETFHKGDKLTLKCRKSLQETVSLRAGVYFEQGSCCKWGQFKWGRLQGKQSQVNVSPIFTLTIALYTRPLAANCSSEHKVCCCLFEHFVWNFEQVGLLQRNWSILSPFLLFKHDLFVAVRSRDLYLRPTCASIFTHKCNTHNWCFILSANKHCLWRSITHMVI